MSSRSKRRTSIPVRLASFYTVVFASFALGCFGVFYFALERHLKRETDEWLLQEAREIQLILAKPGVTDEEIDFELQDIGMIEGLFYFIIDKNGKALRYTQTEITKSILDERGAIVCPSAPKPFFETQEWHEIPFRVVYLPLSPEQDLITMSSIADHLRFLRLLLVQFSYLFPLLLIGVWGSGYFMLKNILRPVQTMMGVARQISAANFSQRIPTRNIGDELDELAASLNEMLEKIDRLLSALREKNDILAHNLRTPLSRIRLDAELALLRDRPVPEYQKALENTLGECDRMLGMLNTMLDIAEVGAEAQSWPKEIIDFDGLLKEVAEVFADIAVCKEISLECHIDSRTLIYGNREKIRQAVVNLLDNAVKYTPSSGKVAIRAFCNRDQVGVRVEDTGIGISPSDRSRIFDSFYRAENARRYPGVGLGLSFVQAVAEAHQGKVEVQSDGVRGSVFTLSFPRNSS